jgi:hypothetical protein
MEQNYIFKEQQRFKQWWLWLILAGINLLFIYGFFKQVIEGQPFGDKPMSDTGMTVATFLTILLSSFFFSLRLETVIKADGIYVRFFPFHVKLKHYPWSMITRSYVRRYAPLTEYGGWGLRYGMFGKGTAFNVSGDQGLQLEFIDKKKLLIGTNKPDALSSALSQIGQMK